VITQYQYERLEYAIDNYNLTLDELKIVDEFLADTSNDIRLDWLIKVLRKRAFR
jgi:hypothetical protein